MALPVLQLVSDQRTNTILDVLNRGVGEADSDELDSAKVQDEARGAHFGRRQRGNERGGASRGQSRDSQVCLIPHPSLHLA